jgi:hypothetical protein
MIDVTVIVATYGDQRWVDLARQRAIPSAAAQAPVLEVHGPTLSAAPNLGAEDAATEWVVFLDADDELEPGYLDVTPAPAADILVPRVRYVGGPTGGDEEPAEAGWPSVVARHPRHGGHCYPACLEYGNFIVVGAPVRRDVLIAVGGFRDLPIWEDWDLWLRCHRAGARFAMSEASVYRAHRSPRGRNQGLTQRRRREVAARITAA